MALKVLAAIDGSKCSTEALERLGRLIPLSGAEVILLTIVPPPPVSDMTGLIGPPYVDATLLLKDMEREAKEILAHGGEILQKHGVTPTQIQKLGDPASAIVETAKAVDLVVVGSHGRTGFRKLLLGSVSSKVVTDTQCPVLVIMGPSPT